MKINKGKHIKQNSEVNITRFSNPVFFLKLSLKNKKSVKKKKNQLATWVGGISCVWYQTELKECTG